MKKILIVLALGLASFAAGLVGIYTLIPTLAPERADEARQQLDSLARLAGAVDTTALPAPDRPALPDTLALAQRGDPAAPAGAAAADSSSRFPPTVELITAALQDSIRVLRQRIAGLERDRQTLQAQVRSLEDADEARRTRLADVTELSATLGKLEDRELQGILRQLDNELLAMLYEKASARNRTRLLQAMPPDQAGPFVRGLMRPGEPAAPPVEPVKTDAAQASEGAL